MIANNAAGNLEKLHSIQAEKSVLGLVLIDNAIYEEIGDLLTIDDFHNQLNKDIYKIIAMLFKELNYADPIRIIETFRTQGKTYENIDSYITSLIETAPSGANVNSYIKILNEKRAIRKLFDETNAIREDIFSHEGNFEHLIDDAERRILEVGEIIKSRKSTYYDLKSILTPFVDKISKLMANKQSVTGVPTGFIDLDKILSGLQPSDLVILAGRPAMGKTAFAINIAANAAIQHQKSVAIFSLEMSKEQIVARLVSSVGMLDAQNIRSGWLKEEEYGKLISTVDVLSKSKMYIDDTPAISIHALLARSRRIKKERDIDLIVVDYLQLMRSGDNYENRVQEISSISMGLKRIAKELNIPVLALSQLSRKLEDRPEKRPLLSDLRESGSIEQDADIVLFVYREEVYKKNDPNLVGLGEIIISKHRNGPIGNVKVTFQNQFTRFDNYQAP